MTPLIMVFPDLYQKCDKNNYCYQDNAYQVTLRDLEYIFDVFFIIDVLINFLRRTQINKELMQIARAYLFGTLIFDVGSIIPLFFGE